MDKEKMLDELCCIAIEAGKLILAIYAKQEVVVSLKDDRSPVTEADLAAHHHIMMGLERLTPQIPVISEENATHPELVEGQPFWLVDPLDGTKSFIKRTGQFTVNIGLIEGGIPTLGIVYLPVQDILYYTGVDGKAYRRDAVGEKVITVRAHDPERGYDVVASQSHRTPETDAFINNLPKVHSLVSAGSSLKFCLVAEGKADLYPRFGATMEWDTAAAHAILVAAGGSMTNPDGTAFVYGKVRQEQPFLNGNFIACGN